MLKVTLFTREDCGLCNDVKSELMRLRNSYPHRLDEVDISADEDAFVRYRYAIPVVRIGEIELRAPISASELEAALKSAALS